MSDDDNKNNDQPRNDASRERTPLTLKPRVGGNVSTGTVKQSFSHGRSKTVVVETKRRINAPSAGSGPQHVRPSAPDVSRPQASQAPRPTSA
ncbi:MAG: translation initiation factor IF-2 associated domain-containing protein, partial [Asticcacaulis sp.]